MPADSSPLEAVLGPAGEKRSARTVRYSFGALLTTQFLGALNDNILKQFLILQVTAGGLWFRPERTSDLGNIDIAFALPFILFSGLAGEVADKWSKRWLAVVLKTVEIPIVCLAGLGIYYGRFWVTFASMVLLEAHSAFFGPAKYGMIPEILPERRLPRGNGSINLSTNLAVIAGILLAGFASDHMRADPAHPDLWVYPHLCFNLLLLVAILGRVAVQFIQPLEPRNPGLRLHANPIHPYLHSFRLMFSSRHIILSAFAWSFFYLVAIAVITAIPDMKENLTVLGEKMTDSHASQITAALGVAVGVGSMAAGFTSRGRISIRPVLLGGIAMTAGLLAFPFVPKTFAPVLGLCVVLGGAAGFYLVPLMSFIQASAPDDARGQFLGTSNFLSFVMVCLSGVLYTVLKKLHCDPQEILGVCGVLFIGVLAMIRNVDLRTPSAKAEPAP